MNQHVCKEFAKVRRCLLATTLLCLPLPPLHNKAARSPGRQHDPLKAAQGTLLAVGKWLSVTVKPPMAAAHENNLARGRRRFTREICRTVPPLPVPLPTSAHHANGVLYAIALRPTSREELVMHPLPTGAETATRISLLGYSGVLHGTRTRRFCTSPCLRLPSTMSL